MLSVRTGVTVSTHMSAPQNFVYKQSQFTAVFQSRTPFQTRQFGSFINRLAEDHKKYLEYKNHLENLDKNFILLRRSDSRSAEELKKGLKAKGPEKDFKSHIELNHPQSFYISFSKIKSLAKQFGFPSFKFDANFAQALLPTYSLIVATKPHIIVNPINTPLITISKDDHVYLDYVNPTQNFAATEGEIAAVGEVHEQDIIGIESQFGVSHFAFPMPFGTFTYLNSNHSPAAFVVNVPSACPDQARRYEHELRKLGRLPKEFRFIYPEEAKEFVETFGERIPPEEKLFHKQQYFDLIPTQVSSSYTLSFIGEMRDKHKKEMKQGVAALLENIKKHSVVVTTSQVATVQAVTGFNKEAIEFFQKHAEENSKTSKTPHHSFFHKKVVIKNDIAVVTNEFKHKK